MVFNAKSQQQRIEADQAIEDIERSNDINRNAALRASFFQRQDVKVLQTRVLASTVTDMRHLQVAAEANILERREKLRIQLEREESEIVQGLAARGLALAS